MKTALRVLAGFLFASTLLECSNDTEPPVLPESLQFRFEPHNSQKDFYTGFSFFTECVNCPDLNDYTVAISPGDGLDTTLTKWPYFWYRYDAPNNYTFRITVKAPGKTYEFDTVLHVRDLQMIYGEPDSEERAEFVAPDGSGGINLIHFLYPEDLDGYYISKVENDLEISAPQPIPQAFHFVHPIFVPAPDGRFAVMGNSRVRLYSPAGSNVAVYELLPSSLLAGRFVDDKLLVAYDSTPSNGVYNKVKIINLTTGSISTKVVSSGTKTLFFTGDDRLMVYNEMQSSVELKEFDLNGVAHLNKIIQKQVGYPAVSGTHSFANTASGKLINLGYDLISLDNNNVERWSIKVPQNNDSWFVESVATSMKEVNGNTFVFFGGFTCWKIDAQGTVLWKKDYYPESQSSQVRGVVLDAAGNFIIVGTRMFDYNPTYYSDAERDIMVFRINQDGIIVD